MTRAYWRPAAIAAAVLLLAVGPASAHMGTTSADEPGTPSSDTSVDVSPDIGVDTSGADVHGGAPLSTAGPGRGERDRSMTTRSSDHEIRGGAGIGIMTDSPSASPALNYDGGADRIRAREQERKLGLER